MESDLGLMRQRSQVSTQQLSPSMKLPKRAGEFLDIVIQRIQAMRCVGNCG